MLLRSVLLQAGKPSSRTLIAPVVRPLTTTLHQPQSCHRRLPSLALPPTGTSAPQPRDIHHSAAVHQPRLWPTARTVWLLRPPGGGFAGTRTDGDSGASAPRLSRAEHAAQRAAKEPGSRVRRTGMFPMRCPSPVPRILVRERGSVSCGKACLPTATLSLGGADRRQRDCDAAGFQTHLLGTQLRLDLRHPLPLRLPLPRSNPRALPL